MAGTSIGDCRHERRDLNDAHQRHGGEIEHQPGARHTREEQRRHGKERELDRERREDRRRDPREQPQPSRVSRAPRRAPSSNASVAPNVRMNPASRTSSGLTTTITAAATDAVCHDPAALVDRTRQEIQHRHQRGTPHRRPGGDDERVGRENDDGRAGSRRPRTPTITSRSVAAAARIAMLPPEMAMT